METKVLRRKSHFACTTIAVGKQASDDGTVIVAHTDDDIADGRVIFVPAADHPENSMRNVYYDDASIGHKPEYNATEARRYIGIDRGPAYDTRDYYDSEPLGAIPQVPHTYAYFDGSYGIINEHQLSIGECTCGALVTPEPEPGKRIFYSAELSRVALERCTTARDAVLLMGELILKYGYYGTGETLLVGDPDEAWVMEMCGYDAAGSGGIWVARRVPDDGFFVAANQFRIRTVAPGDSDILYSPNLFEVCQEKKWWDPHSGALDWLRAVSHGEYSHPYYSLRRVWRAQSLAAPSIKRSPWVSDGYTTEYPFAVVPDSPLKVSDIAAILRDSYEGTEFDPTQGLAAGPWGDPTRYDVNPDQNVDTFNLESYRPSGAWERPISIYRCALYYINQSRRQLPHPIGALCWLGLHRPSTSCLMPLYPGLNSMPKALETMNVLQLQRDSAWWASAAVGNYASLKWRLMIDDIAAKAALRERHSAAESAATDAQALGILNVQGLDSCRSYLAERSEQVVTATMTDWWDLFDHLMVKYNSGGITTSPECIMEHADYPRSWLAAVGFFAGPIAYEKQT